MTINEAIEFEKAEVKGERQLYDNGGFAEYHEQIIEWLEELKRYREVSNQLNELINGSPLLKDIFEMFTIKEQNNDNTRSY